MAKHGRRMWSQWRNSTKFSSPTKCAFWKLRKKESMYLCRLTGAHRHINKNMGMGIWTRIDTIKCIKRKRIIEFHQMMQSDEWKILDQIEIRDSLSMKDMNKQNYGKQRFTYLEHIRTSNGSTRNTEFLFFTLKLQNKFIARTFELRSLRLHDIASFRSDSCVSGRVCVSFFVSFTYE